MAPLQAALRGAREVGFTVLSMSLSLIAVFIPDPAHGRHRRAPVPRVRGHAVGGDPGLAGGLADHDADDVRAPSAAASPHARPRRPRLASLERALLSTALHALRASARAGRCAIRCSMLLMLFATIGLNVYLYTIVPKGFFPQQDTGRLVGFIQADQSISFQAMRAEARRRSSTSCSSDPAVDNVVAFTGGGQRQPGLDVHRAQAARRAQACRRRR